MKKYNGPAPEALVESAIEHIHFFEENEFFNFKISVKSSQVLTNLVAYRMLSERCDYPLHIGVTEAGGIFSGLVKSSIGIGLLLYEGIGDTIRVSLTGDPIYEVRAAFAILRTLKIRDRGVDIISCPTCARCKIDLIPLVEEIEKRIAHIETPITVAIMGCEVNGPGEAKEADVGIAAGKNGGLLFSKGKIIEKIDKSHLADRLIEEIYRFIEKKNI